MLITKRTDKIIMIDEKRIPTITFQCRVGDEEPSEGGCPIGGEFVGKTTDELFGNKRVIVFSLPGAFTPTCSTYQLPGFEENYEAIKEMGIDEVYVSSVNDSFVMNAWAKHLGIKNIKVIPDGNGELAESLGMLIDFSSKGFGMRSRRFAVVINNGVVEKGFIEPEASKYNDDPYGETSPENVIRYIKQK
tara:strand:- start:161 stop:730 length:570 start_codon:yes stop_codon:yes gene_type:complete